MTGRWPTSHKSLLRSSESSKTEPSEPSDPVRPWLTGGTGFVGSNIVQVGVDSGGEIDPGADARVPSDTVLAAPRTRLPSQRQSTPVRTLLNRFRREYESSAA